MAKAKMAAPILGVLTLDVRGVRVVLLMCLLFGEDAGFGENAGEVPAKWAAGPT
jgi:hypothetical protein